MRATYMGKTCERHPELRGERTMSSHCVACKNDEQRARDRANRPKRYRAENLQDLHRLWWPNGGQPSAESRVSPHSDPGAESRI